MYTFTCQCGTAQTSPTAHTVCTTCGLEIFLDWDFAIRQVGAKPKEQPPITLTDTANK